MTNGPGPFCGTSGSLHVTAGRGQRVGCNFGNAYRSRRHAQRSTCEPTGAAKQVRSELVPRIQPRGVGIEERIAVRVQVLVVRLGPLVVPLGRVLADEAPDGRVVVARLEVVQPRLGVRLL